MRLLSATLVAFFALFEVVKCGENLHRSPWSRRHNLRADVVAQPRQQNGVPFTYYQPGMGACGKVNVATDYIVALNAVQFEGGKYCFKIIIITVGGKSAQAMITDMCPGCGPGGLDLTPSLFEFFGSESTGVLTGSWVFGSAPSPSPTPTPTPTSTSKYVPPSSSTSSVTPTSTVTSTQPPTSTQSTPSSVSTGTSTSVSPTPTPLIPTQETGNIANLFLVLIEIGSMVTLAHG